MAKQIPDRWLNYQPIGDRIEGTRFIAFKVPLREHINKNVNETNKLHGKLLLEKIPNLGVIIDLTNTNRYYDTEFFKKEGVEHKKLMIPGHVTPSPRLVNRFKEFVKQFIQNNPDNDKLIGVHCTHGVNRTGYLICNYMVSEMAIDPVEAIKKFSDARGHKIERQNYVDSLHTLKNKNTVSQNKEKRSPNEGIEEITAKVRRIDVQVHEEDSSRNWRHRESRIEHRNERNTERNAQFSRHYNMGNNSNDPRSIRRYPDTNANSNRLQWRRDPTSDPRPSVPLPVVERKRKAFDEDLRDQPYHRSNPPPAIIMRPSQESTPYDGYNNNSRFNNNPSTDRYSRDNRNCHNDYRTRDFNNKRPLNLSHPSTTSNCDSRTNRSIRTDNYKDSRTKYQDSRYRSSATSWRHHE